MISVIIPTFNCAAYLDDCLRGVFAQTHTDFEVIVVDDGSTDNTRAVLKPWTERILFFTGPNAGVAAARNKGLRVASGEFIAFLDADDIWAPPKLAAQVELLERAPSCGLVCSDFAIMEQNGSFTPSYFARTSGFQTGNVFTRLILDCFIFTSTVMMRRSVLDRVGDFDESIPYCDDYNMWLRAAHCAEISVVPQVLATKCERPGNQRAFDATAVKLIAALRHLFDQLPDLGDSENSVLTAEIHRLEEAVGTYLLGVGRHAEARKHLGNVPWSPSTSSLLALTYAPPSAVQVVRRLRRMLRGAPQAR